MSDIGLFLVALGVLAFTLVSGWVRHSSLTPPMVFTLLGVALGLAGFGFMDINPNNLLFHVLAEITLVLLLFTDAARIDIRRLIADHNLPLRMLLIGLPLAVAFGTLVAMGLPLGLSAAEAALLAAILAPTDAALGAAVVANKDIPVRVRQTINVEAGMNDGIAVPFVLLFAGIVASGVMGGGQPLDEFALFATRQIAVGIGVGTVVGWAGAKLIKDSVARGNMLGVFEGAAILGLVACLFTLAELLGGNGLIAAFTGGLLYGYRTGGHCEFVLEFAETEGRLLTLLVFTLFGATMLPLLAAGLSWSMVIFAGLALTIIRMLPVALSLLGTGLKRPTVLFLGWFGPRGLASILLMLLVANEVGVALSHPIMLTAILTVGLSIFLHGITAAPFARRYSALAALKDECPEKVPVSEMPLQTG